ncbi:MAG: alpha/beta hydrolase [Candidatus Aminicenantes bacterium]|nr:alpha/beta hydrolase [Candidatus Aminicenantes bacterium]
MKYLFKALLLSMSVLLLIVGCAKQDNKHTTTVDSALSADGVSIHYQVQGKGKPALIFIHGWCCDRSYWDEQLSHFTQQYKVVAIDLAGHGDSGLERKAWTMEAYGEDVVAVVNKLKLQEVILVGHSMGGYVILEAARRLPERIIGLVGVDTLNDFTQQISQEEIDAFFTPFRSNFVEMTRHFVRTMFTENADPALIEKIVEDMSAAPPEVGLGSFEEMIDYMKHTYLEAVQEVKVPITCINSDKYPTNREGNKRYVPSYKAKIMTGVGHFNMIEDPDTFNRLLEETVQEFYE